MKSISLVRLGLAAAALMYVGVATAAPASAEALSDGKAIVQVSQAGTQKSAVAQQPCAAAEKAAAPKDLEQPAIGGYQRQMN